MRNVVIGIVIGIVLGVVIGASVIAPRIQPDMALSAEAPIPVPLETSKPKTPATSVKLPPPTVETKVAWNMASAFDTSLPVIGNLAKRLPMELWRISGGGFRLELKDRKARLPAGHLHEEVIAGKLDAAFTTPEMLGGKVPSLRLFSSIPFGPAAEEYLSWIYYGGGKELYEALYRKQGLHGIFCGIIAPEASGWFRKPIHTVKDFQNLPVRIDGLGAKVLADLGAEPHALVVGDTFMALENGIIDAAVFSLPVIDEKLGIQRLLDHYYFPGWQKPATLFDLTINLKKWNSLTVTQQARIETVCGDNIRYGLAEAEALQFEALKSLQIQNVHIHRWPPEILDALERSWRRVAKKESDTDASFKRVWRSLQSFRRDHAIWRELSRPQ